MSDLSNIESIAKNIEVSSMDETELLRSLYKSIDNLSKNGLTLSQASLQDLAASERSRQETRNVYDRRQNTYDERRQRTSQYKDSRRVNQNDDYFDDSYFKRNSKKNRKGLFDSILDSFEDEVKKSVFGSKNPVKDVLNSSIRDLAQKLGTSVDGIGDEVGARLGKAFGEHLKTNPIDKRIIGRLQKASDKLNDRISNTINNIGDKLAGIQVDDISVQAAEDIERESASNDYSKFVKNRNIDDLDPIDVEYKVVNDKDNKPKDESKSQSNKGEGPNISDVADLVKNLKGQKGSNLVKTASDKLSKFSPEKIAKVFESGSKSVANLAKGSNTASKAMSSTSKLLTTSASSTSTALSTTASSAGTFGKAALAAAKGGLAKFGSAAAAAATSIPGIGLIIATAALTINKITAAVQNLKKGMDEFKKSVKSAYNRIDTQNSRNLELWKNRVAADQKAIVQAAYDVIEQSAEKIQSTWDSVLTTVSATQGYDKAGVQDLWSGYAKRLQEAELASYISSSDIMEQLESVLKSGLSGAVAEEFAYQATLLNKAIPSVDFFQLAQSYATVAANALQRGADEAEAIDRATAELRQYASNFLYASREIAGGFTTTLNSSISALFEDSLKIAQTSRVGDVSEISGVLTSVSALVGSIAPDLASSLVDAVTRAATGGNASELTALRSMAGTGASNTAFLNAFAQDPKDVFENLFRNLSQLQNMSAQNYMEVAEALSTVFGVSMDAFARVDFAYLADAIAAMNTNNTALNENLEMLVSGQTTSTQEQLRMQKINEYMVEQGLAYVLDNEVARSIQQHMWEEQLAREIEETTFAVDLTGGAMELLNGIATFLKKLWPGNWFEGFKELELTALEAAAQAKEVQDIVQASVVGTGNAVSYYQLTNNKAEDLKVATSYLELLGRESNLTAIRDQLQERYEEQTASSTVGKIWDKVTSWFTGGNSTTHISSSGEVHGGTSGKFGDATTSSHGGGHSFGTSNEDYSSSIVSKSAAETTRAAQKSGVMASNSKYRRSLVSKSSVSTISSGDYRTDVGYNPIWDTTDQVPVAKTQADAKKLSSSMMTDLTSYIDNIYNNTAAKQIENSRKIVEQAANTITATEDGLHRDYYTQAQILEQVTSSLTSGAIQQGSFEEWKEQFEKSLGGSQKLEEILADYGTDIYAVQSAFNELESARTSAATKARELHEVQFWEDMQNFATKDFPWYMREWERYYIQHEAYTTATNEAYHEAVNLATQEKGESSDAVYALAKALTDNNNWDQITDAIKDPTVQTNTLLARILLTVEAIMQNQNEVSTVSIPTSLTALSLGITST